ncbi:MAG: MBL fold metallo-hydrolase [Candidatus Baltobacteraceae bacterium]
MFFKQFYLGCLSHASYLLGSDGMGIVIDPQRDVDLYIDEAERQGLKIQYIVETHLHADFVSGHRELAQRTGARIVVGARAGARFEHHAAREGDLLEVGALEVRIIETPGHTPESISMLVTDRSDPEAAPKLFTGDTLFVGDVGRPDLAATVGFSPAEMAAMMYDTIHEKLLRLDDRVLVYPAHGAGSLCGRNISQETWSTIGAQRRENYALKPMRKDEFVTMMTLGLPEAPAYFSKDAAMNRDGALSLSNEPVPTFDAAETAALLKDGALLLDVRPSESYGPEHVHGSLNIGLDGQFASWAGTLLDFQRPVILLAENAQDVGQAVLRLARVGFSAVRGALEGGIAAWKDAGFPTSSIEQITVQEFARLLRERAAEMCVLDVRRPAEVEAAAIRDAISIPLDRLPNMLDRIDMTRTLYALCGSGYRSSIAASLLEAAGHRDLVNVDGGMNMYREAGFAVVEPAVA